MSQQILDLTRLVGYARTRHWSDVPEVYRTITLAIEDWIEDNHGLIKAITISPKFHSMYQAETTRNLDLVDTFVGIAVVIVDEGQTEDVIIHGEE